MRLVAGCLLVLIGMFLGAGAGFRWASYAAEAEAARIRADDPDEYICGLIVLPYLALGVGGGGLAGGACGLGLAHRLRRSRRGFAREADPA